MNKEQLIKVAKSHIKEFIFFQAKLDNRNITFPQTELILDNRNIDTVDEDDIIMVNDLKRAYKFVLTNIDTSVDDKFAIKVNKLVAQNEALKVDQFRDTTIGISGVEKARKPVGKEIFEYISNNKDFTELDDCIDWFLELCTLQFFYDGNKRTASLLLNKQVINNELGFYSIYSEHLEEFSNLLNNYYNELDDSKDKIRDFIKTNCILYKDGC